MKTNLQKDLEQLNKDIKSHVDSYISDLELELNGCIDYLQESCVDSDNKVNFSDVENIFIGNSRKSFIDRIGEFYDGELSSEYDLDGRFEAIIEDNEKELKDDDSDFHTEQSDKLESLSNMFFLSDNDYYAQEIVKILENEYKINFKKLVNAVRL
jgi:hypothetical protein